MYGTESQKFGSLSCLDGYIFLDRLWQKYVKPLSHRQQYSQYLLLSLLLIGMFHPTSWQTDISVFFRRSSIYLLNFLLFILFLLNGLGDRRAYRCGLAIPFILFIATFFSPLKDITLGAYVFFLPISLLFCVNLRNVCWDRLLSLSFVAVNVVIIVSAIAIVFDILQIERMFFYAYSAFYESLLSIMLDLGKPVSVFASHSIASFMYFIFFYLNFKIFLHDRKIVYLLFAIFYFCFLFFLKSNAAYYSIVLSLLVVSPYVNYASFRYRKVFFFILFFIVTVVSVVYLTVDNFLYDFFVEFFNSIKVSLSTPTAGFLGRYSSGGVLAGNIQYILGHPFSPVGLRNSHQFWFMDSGIIEYLLRGSILLVLVIYYGLFRFLRFHLPSRSTCWLLFIIVLINELGFPYLKYFRFMYLLPFLVVYLRHLELELPLQNTQG